MEEEKINHHGDNKKSEDGKKGDVTSFTGHNLSEAMKDDPKLDELIGKLNGFGIQNPDIDTVKTMLNNLKRRLEEEKKGRDKMEEIDIKYALIMVKPYENSYNSFVFEKVLEEMEIEKIYELIGIVEKFGLRFDDFIDFKNIYDTFDIKELYSKLALLQLESFSPKTLENLILLKDMDAERLSEYKDENHGKKLTFYDLYKEYKRYNIE